MEHENLWRLRRSRAVCPHRAGWRAGRAERATGIPKATLSRRLSALEETLNVRLARRTKKGVVLTEQGQQLFERGQAAFMLAEQAVAEVQG